MLGEPVTDWQSLVLPDIRGRMRINDDEVGTGYGRDIIKGHPLEALVWLANEQSMRGRDLPADWIVMLLGSVVPTKWVSKRDVVVAELDGLGTAKLHSNNPSRSRRATRVAPHPTDPTRHLFFGDEYLFVESLVRE